MAVRIPSTNQSVVREQALIMRERYPELYAHLAERDRKLRRAIGRVPSPADIELSATWNQRRFVESTLRAYGDGVEELAAGD